MKNFLFNICMVLAILVATAFVIIAHSPFPGMMSVFFIGLGLTYAVNPEIKKLPNYITSSIAGIGWALFYFWIDGLLRQVVSADLALWIGVFIFVILSAVLHIMFLNKTWLNQIPLVYGAVTCVFVTYTGSIEITQFLGIILIMCFGIIVAVMSGPIAGLITKKPIDETK